MLSNRLILTFFLKIFLCSSYLLLVHGADPNDLTRLRIDLRTGYDRNARPIKNHQNTTTVQINPYFRGFEYDEARSIFTYYCWTVMTWNDEHFKWNPQNYGNLTSVHFTPREIWLPDVSIYNNFDQSEVDHFQNTRVIVYYYGFVLWVPPTKFQVGCGANTRKWPYDVQECKIVIGSWSHDGNALDLAIPVNKTKISGAEVAENVQWEHLETKVERRSYTINEIPYPDIQLTVRIRRRSPVHTAAFVIPGIAISIAILISFWLRPGAPERLALIMLVIIVNAIYLNNIYNQIVTHGDNVPLMLLFYRDSLTMVSVALIWTICLRYLAATKRDSPVPLPGWIESLLTSIFGKILCLDPRPTGPGSSGGTDGDDEGKLVGSNNPHGADWAWLAHLLDRVAFLIYFIVYLCFYLALL